MIRVKCPGCASKLKAKSELAGQTRKCPKCGAAFVVPEGGQAEDYELDSAGGEDLIHDVLDHDLPKVEAPQRLAWQNRYLICTPEKLFSAWEGNGHGWMLKTTAGFIRASRNLELLPNQGDFTLVELRIATSDGQHRLSGIRSYRLAARWALLSLGREENEILSKIIGTGALNRSQKEAVKLYLRETLMPEVWHESRDILDYLANTDYHSSGVG